MAAITESTHPTQSHSELKSEKMPGHWLLARMGKRVLRPGGLESTRTLLSELAINEHDRVVEFAPGLGVTARMTLAKHPQSYTAIERDRDAAAIVEGFLTGPEQRCLVATAEQSSLASGSASVVYGEAMLSMQMPSAKQRIIAEAARLLEPGGRYGIHELCLTPDTVDESTRLEIEKDLSSEIHVGVRPLTAGEWRELLESSGLTVTAQKIAPMHLLEPARMIRDEGFFGALRFAWKVLNHAPARQRVRAMRAVFRKHRRHLAAIVLVARKENA